MVKRSFAPGDDGRMTEVTEARQAAERALGEAGEEQQEQRMPEEPITVKGTVRWFDPVRKFGDAAVHGRFDLPVDIDEEVLVRSGLTTVEPGWVLEILATEKDPGRELSGLVVHSIKVIIMEKPAEGMEELIPGRVQFYDP